MRLWFCERSLGIGYRYVGLAKSFRDQEIMFKRIFIWIVVIIILIYIIMHIYSSSLMVYVNLDEDESYRMSWNEYICGTWVKRKTVKWYKVICEKVDRSVWRISNSNRFKFFSCVSQKVISNLHIDVKFFLNIMDTYLLNIGLHSVVNSIPYIQNI